MAKILVTYDMFREGFTELESNYDVTFPEGRDFTYEEVLEMIPEYDVLCSMFDFPVNKELVDHAPNLKLVANYAVGYNNIDVAYCLEKGITVANTPDPVTAPTANLALGLMIDTARRITECDRKLRTLGKEMKVGVLENLGVNITGQTLGIIGMGRIGKALAKRANACGMEVIYHNRRPLYVEEETKLNVMYVSKEELLAKSDFVSLNAPYTPDTYHIIGEAELKQMKPSAILINTARGPLVDEHALVKALQDGTIHGAGLDVFEFGDYPLPELLEMDNVVLTPHIGTQTLDVVRANDDLEVVGLAAGSNVEMLEKQIREFHPRLVAVWKEEAARDLAVRVQDLDVKIVSQMGGLIELARMEESDILVTAIVGMIGIRPTMEAILAGKDIALANKETLVTAGHLIMPLAKQFGVQILPVDSEHSAIFQALHGEKREQIHKLLITASGGPFRGKKTADLEKVTLEDTLKHPNWVMGQKITVDSATLVNKGLEVMEARWLFDVDLDHIQVVVQPQSIIHSMVEFEDGAVMAQLGTPDMRLPIQYALCYPDRRFLKGDRLDFHMLKQITFEEPDRKTFKGLPMAVEAARAGGSMPTVFNAANELAVRKFLQKKISFLDIYEIIGQSMSRHTAVKDPDLDQILEIEKETYRWIESRW